ncbi:MAG: flagellar hook-basal body complex protein, partial [Thermodesulfobacteriota bacterium]
MLSALFTGISGLQANMSSMSVIGDNLANLNTIGFKGSRSSFADLLAQSIGGTSGQNQIGLGVKLSSVSPIFKQGSLESTGNATDLAIEGDGFFVVTDSASTNYYTRAGQFGFDRDGYLVNPESYFVQGYTADSLGNLGSIVGDIQLSNAPVPPLATQNMNLAVNLDSDSDVTGFTFTPGGLGNDEIDFTASAGAVTASITVDGGLVAGRPYTGAQAASAIRTAME